MNLLKQVRKREGLSIRGMSRRLGITQKEYRMQEAPDYDPRLSELCAYSNAMSVPIEELIKPLGTDYSYRFLLERALVLKAYKSAMSLREMISNNSSAKELSIQLEQLVTDLLQAFPELDGSTLGVTGRVGAVHAWQKVGARRGLDNPNNYGRTLHNIIPASQLMPEIGGALDVT